MRSSCPDCVRKHIAQAIILLAEARLGYPDHVWLAMGHLAEAEAEVVGSFPEIATYIRHQRLLIQKGKDVVLLPLIRLISSMVESERKISDTNYINSDVRDVSIPLKDWDSIEKIKDAVDRVYEEYRPDHLKNRAEAVVTIDPSRFGETGRAQVKNALDELEGANSVKEG